MVYNLSKTGQDTKIFFTIFFVFLSLQLLISCSTVSPVSLEREKPAVFVSVEGVEPLWQDLAQGVGYFCGKIVSPKMEFWALRIDLSLAGIVVRDGAGHLLGEEIADNKTALSVKVSSFVRDNGLLAGVNAVPFDVVSSRERRPIQNMGIVVSEGKLLAAVNPRYDALVFYKDGRAAIVRQSAILPELIEEIENALGGFHRILSEGEAAERTLHGVTRHPRSAAGISAGGGYLYLLVIDGRRPGSLGATERETALLLRSLGCEDGINFDGGGSSTLALRFPDGKVRTVNTPIHGQIPGRERAVAGCIGVGNQLNPSTEK